MAANTDITAELVRKLLDYDPETGVLTWKARTPDMFASNRYPRERNCAIWNTRYAGKRTGCLGPDGYVYVGINNRARLAHRVIWCLVYGEWPPFEVDHHNLKKSDNRLENLRSATHAENKKNVAKSKKSTTGFKGVTYNKQNGKYQAQIKTNGKYTFLKYHDTPEEAHRAYCEAAARLHGEFARFE